MVATQKQTNLFQLNAKKALLERGQTVTDLAKSLDLARNTVSIAINHPSMFPTVKSRIARSLGILA